MMVSVPAADEDTESDPGMPVMVDDKDPVTLRIFSLTDELVPARNKNLTAYVTAEAEKRPHLATSAVLPPDATLRPLKVPQIGADRLVKTAPPISSQVDSRASVSGTRLTAVGKQARPSGSPDTGS
jgi:hypothetical protein